MSRAVILCRGGHESNILAGCTRLLAFNYINDTTIFMPAPMGNAVRHISTSRTVETFDNLPLGPVLESLSEKSLEIGVKINTKNTQLMVFSPPKGCYTTAVIYANGVRFKSEENLKLVGFHFGSSPGAMAHIIQLKKKLKAKIWMFYHLLEA